MSAYINEYQNGIEKYQSKSGYATIKGSLVFSS
jgi:hypothetical protein